MEWSKLFTMCYMGLMLACICWLVAAAVKVFRIKREIKAVKAEKAAVREKLARLQLGVLAIGSGVEFRRKPVVRIRPKEVNQELMARAEAKRARKAAKRVKDNRNKEM